MLGNSAKTGQTQEKGKTQTITRHGTEPTSPAHNTPANIGNLFALFWSVP